MLTDPDQAVSQGETYLKNAKDALGADVNSEEELYIWENQVEVIDEFLADTEDVDGGDELADLRSELRQVKEDLEKQTMEFLGEDQARQASDEEMVESFIAFAEELIPDIDQVLDADIQDAQEAKIALEPPLGVINSLLADTEPYKDDEELAELREQLKMRKMALEEKIASLHEDWRAAELETEG